MKFTKVRAGHYATADGTYFVAVDAYMRGHATDDEIGTGGEWAAVYAERGEGREDHNSGETIEWFATKREAVAACIEHAARPAKSEDHAAHMASIRAHYAERAARAARIAEEREHRAIEAGCNVHGHDFVDGECTYCGTPR